MSNTAGYFVSQSGRGGIVGQVDIAPPPERRGDTVRTAYDKLRELILDGTYHPGHRLTQGELSEVLGVGRTPLREALRMLQADGFLVSVANRGVTVSRVDLGAAEELYALRLLVEPPLLSSLAGTFSEAELAQMQESLIELDNHSDRSREFQEHHLAFHQVALARYGAATEKFVKQLYRRIMWAQRSYMSRPRTARDFIGVDTQLLAALRAGDGPAAKQLLQFHLIDAALGLILDVDDEHVFEPLIRACRGLGIDLENADGQVHVPAGITWRSQDAPQFVTIESSNLRVAEPAAAVGS